MIKYEHTMIWNHYCDQCNWLVPEENIRYCDICSKMLCGNCIRYIEHSIDKGEYCNDCYKIGGKYIKQILELEKSFENIKRKWMIDKLLETNLNIIRKIKYIKNVKVEYDEIISISCKNNLKWNNDKTKLLIKMENSSYEVPLSSIIEFNVEHIE